MIGGTSDPRFVAVQEAFGGNLAAGLEGGAACAVVVNGRLVVDVWGGVADDASGTAWERDTLVDCRSATKGLTALCVAILADRGEIDIDAPVRRYWPALRIDPTVRQALSHQAGIPIVDDVPAGRSSTGTSWPARSPARSRCGRPASVTGTTARRSAGSPVSRCDG